MLEKILSENLGKVLDGFSGELGDRSLYVGASDIGKCERNVVLTKINGVNHQTKQKMVMIRGHLAETIVRLLLKKAGLFFEEQYEVTHPQYGFIKAHIDFLFQAKNAKGVLEVKTTTGIPDEPYESWVMQLCMQMGLVKLNFPKDKVKGAILVLDLASGEIREFNGFEPNDELFSALVNKAKVIYEKVQNKQTENLETEVSSLCAFCPFKADCPEFSGDEQNVSKEIVYMVNKYRELSDNEKTLKKEKDSIKQTLIDTIGEGVLKFNGNKVTVKNTVRKALDSKALQKSMPEVYEQFLIEREIVYFRVD